MLYEYRNQPTHFFYKILRGNLNLYKGTNVDFTVFEFPLRLFYNQMIGDNICTRL